MHSSYPSRGGKASRTLPSSRSMNLDAVSHSRSLWPIEQPPPNFYEQPPYREHSVPLYPNQCEISFDEPYPYLPIQDERQLPGVEYYAYRDQFHETRLNERMQRHMDDQTFLPMNPYPNLLPSSRLDHGSFSNPVRRTTPRRSFPSSQSLPLSDLYLSPIPYANDRPRSAQSETLSEGFPALLSPPPSVQPPHIQRLGNGCLHCGIAPMLASVSGFCAPFHWAFRRTLLEMWSPDSASCLRNSAT